MTFRLSQRSLKKMAHVHPDLVKVVKRAIKLSAIDFLVLEGSRTKERQQTLFDEGASKTLNSRHLVQPDGYAHAVDLAALIGGKVRWDWPLYHQIAGAMKHAAESLGVPLEWGGDWRTFKDGPHFQLPRNYDPR